MTWFEGNVKFIRLAGRVFKRHGMNLERSKYELVLDVEGIQMTLRQEVWVLIALDWPHTVPRVKQFA